MPTVLKVQMLQWRVSSTTVGRLLNGLGYRLQPAGKPAAVRVGRDHDTPAFAVASIRYWWCWRGQRTYPDATSLHITADAGGSNGYRSRAWKHELQQLAVDAGLTIHASHLPPGTSKCPHWDTWYRQRAPGAGQTRYPRPDEVEISLSITAVLKVDIGGGYQSSTSRAPRVMRSTPAQRLSTLAFRCRACSQSPTAPKK